MHDRMEFVAEGRAAAAEDGRWHVMQVKFLTQLAKDALINLQDLFVLLICCGQVPAGMCAKSHSHNTAQHFEPEINEESS